MNQHTHKTHCKYGHEFTEANTARTTRGTRRCRKCSNRRGKEWTTRHPEYQPLYRSCRAPTLKVNARKNHLRREYGITPSDYDNMLADQGGRCRICQERRTLVVDHDHSTGRVRGLLCNCCNRCIGQLGDQYESVSKAQTYLVRELWKTLLEETAE